MDYKILQISRVTLFTINDLIIIDGNQKIDGLIIYFDYTLFILANIF